MGMEAITLGAKVFVFYCPVFLYIVQSIDAQREYRDQVSPGPGPWLDLHEEFLSYIAQQTIEDNNQGI